jgi:hypothetical protein
MDRKNTLIAEADLLMNFFPQLRLLLDAHNSDPDQILGDHQNFTKTAESYHTLLKTRSQDEIYDQLKFFFSTPETDAFNIFPTAEEIKNELVPILQPLRKQLPFYTTNLNLSSPVAVAETTSLNVIIRLYNADKKNIIKIKIGSFADRRGKIYWEVGFVDVFKSIRDIEEFSESRFHSKGDYFLLMRLVNCTKTFIERRPRVSGLDLTPAYYHVLQLCKRLGGRTTERFDWPVWQRNLDEAYQYSRNLEIDGLKSKQFETINKRYVISWMFENGSMRDPSGKPLMWTPPRLIAENPRSR